MKRLAFALALCIPLPGCESLLTSPSELSDESVIDEKAAIGFELAYTAASKAGTTLARADLIDATEWAALDNRAYTALQAVRAAYRAGNAEGFDIAVAELQTAIAAINSAMENVR